VLEDPFFTFFFSVGFIVLLKLVWQDFKNNKMVDTRYSSYMLGIVTTMFFLKGEIILLLILMILTALVLMFRHRFSQGIFKKYMSVGSGDVTILTWVLIGLFYFNAFSLLVFALFYFIGQFASSLFFKEKFFVGTPSILIGFVFAWIFINIMII